MAGKPLVVFAIRNKTTGEYMGKLKPHWQQDYYFGGGHSNKETAKPRLYNSRNHASTSLKMLDHRLNPADYEIVTFQLVENGRECKATFYCDYRTDPRAI